MIQNSLRYLYHSPTLFSFLLGCLLNLTLPPIGWWFVMPLCLSPILFLLSACDSSKLAFKISFFFQFGYFVLGLYWISLSFGIDWTQFWFLVPFAGLGIPAAMALLLTPILWILWFIKPDHPFSQVLLLAIVWTLFDIIRTYVFPQFPWNLMGYTVSSFTPILQAASFSSVFGLTFLSIFFGSLLYLLLKSRPAFYVTTGFLVCLMVFGIARLSLNSNTYSEETKIRLVQPNISQKMKWNAMLRQKNLTTLMELTGDNAADTLPNFVIWPEAALPYFIEEEPGLRQLFKTRLGPTDMLITGATRREKTVSPLGTVTTTRIWNSILALNTHGEMTRVYDKTWLVPFGEYIPLRGLLNWLPIPITKLTHGTLDFSEGDSDEVFSLPNLPPFIPLICYEIAFPMMLDHDLKSPRLIMNVTNDAWFGTSSGPYQHLHMAQVRAVELGIPALRSANTGVSAVISPYGEIMASLPLNTAGVLDTFLPNPTPSPTLFNLYGFWTTFFFVLGFSALGSTLVNMFSKRK